VPVLCELLWVLSRGYKAPRSELAEVVQNLLEDQIYAVEHRDSVERALARFQRGKGDFADYLIQARGRAHGSQEVLSFDRGLSGEDGFTVI